MDFCVLKALNWFFQFSWKEKACLLSAANIEHKNLQEKIHIYKYKAFFLTILKKFLKETKNSQKYDRLININFLFEISMLDIRRSQNTCFFFSRKLKKSITAFKTQKIRSLF